MSLGLTPDLPPLTKPQKSAWLLGKLETCASLLPFPAPASSRGLLPADAAVPGPSWLVGALHSGQASHLGSRGPLAKGQQWFIHLVSLLTCKESLQECMRRWGICFSI